MANHLPLRAKLSEVDGSYDFEWDEDALTAQAKVRGLSFAQENKVSLFCHQTTDLASLPSPLHRQEGIPDGTTVLYLGCLPVEIESADEEVNCHTTPPTFIFARVMHWIRTPIRAMAIMSCNISSATRSLDISKL